MSQPTLMHPTRAITSLLKRDLLIYRPHIRYWDKAKVEAMGIRQRRSIEDHLAMHWGYVLTAEGADIGSQHELDISDSDLFSTLAKLWCERRGYHWEEAHVAEWLRRAALAAAA